MRIYLTGFMGAGKTSVGRALAQKLGWDFVDLDFQIEDSSKESIEDIFSSAGEQEFRKRETQQLRQLNQENIVIATGGGAFIHNHDWMLQNGMVVYLEVPFEVLVSRIGAETSRPLWKNAQQLFEERQKIYESAHLRINAARDVDLIVADIVGLLGI